MKGDCIGKVHSVGDTKCKLLSAVSSCQFFISFPFYICDCIHGSSRSHLFFLLRQIRQEVEDKVERDALAVDAREKLHLEFLLTHEPQAAE